METRGRSEPRIYVATYHPLCLYEGSPGLLDRVKGVPRYVDSSVRREPDLELPLPTISALCRLDLFAPKLIVGDKVIYLGVKRRYGQAAEGLYPLTAVLEVSRLFASHEEAATWYEAQGMRRPYNTVCSPHCWDTCSQQWDKEAWLANYDKRYQGWRTGKNDGKMVREPNRVKCIISRTPRFLALQARSSGSPPPLLSEMDLRMALVDRMRGKARLGTQNPCTISNREYENLVGLSKVANHEGWLTSC